MEIIRLEGLINFWSSNFLGRRKEIPFASAKVHHKVFKSKHVLDGKLSENFQGVIFQVHHTFHIRPY